jgi:hypothetical protein
VAGVVLAVSIAVLIAVASGVEVPGVSKIIRPAEPGIGTECAEGDLAACRDLCPDLAKVSNLRCGEQKHARNVGSNPISGGGDLGTGNPHPPGGQSGGGHHGPPPSPPKPGPLKPPGPPSSPRDCIVNALGVCVPNPLG